MFKTKFRISLEWLDSRLRYENIRRGFETLLSESDKAKIWTPTVLLDDLDQFSRFAIVFSIHCYVFGSETSL